MEYNEIHYSDVIYQLEQKWKRELTNHERNVLIEGYKYGRQVEAENEIKFIEFIRRD